MCLLNYTHLLQIRLVMYLGKQGQQEHLDDFLSFAN